MLVSAELLGVFILAGIVTPSLLLLLTFILGLGSAMNAPALQGAAGQAPDDRRTDTGVPYRQWAAGGYPPDC